MRSVYIVTATQSTEAEFWKNRPLGRSLKLFPNQSSYIPKIYFSNTGEKIKGLSEIYNSAIQQAQKDDLLLLVHDDVFIADFFLAQRLNDAHAFFDIVGIAGNVNPDYAEPSWCLAWNKEKYPKGWQPFKNFSGSMLHNINGDIIQSYYGAAPKAVNLLDGLFLSVKAGALQSKATFFDPCFRFHFYDLDFCRKAYQLSLKIGTWPIAVMHYSGGNFESPEWESSKQKYFDKWGKQ